MGKLIVRWMKIQVPEDLKFQNNLMITTSLVFRWVLRKGEGCVNKICLAPEWD